MHLRLLEVFAATGLGLVAGSFLSTLVLRLPAGRPVVVGRSGCPNCGHTLSAVELVPILSWAIQGGKCRWCAQPISGFYPAMEIAAALVGLWASLVTSGVVLGFSCVLGWCLLALAVMDLRTLRLADALTAFLFLGGLAAAIILDPERIWEHVIGSVAGFVGLYVLAIAYRALRGRDGLGLGDAKLLGGAGAWLGWEALPSVVLLASVSGLLAVSASAVAGRKVTLETRLPFGAFLSFGVWIVWLYGPMNS